MRTRGWAIALAALVVVAGCSSDDGGGAADVPADATTASIPGATVAATTTTGLPLPEPVLEDRECVPEAVAEVAEGVTYDCHWLVVPENRAAFDGDTLRLAVTVLHSTAAEPLPDPVVYLSGGPGGAGGSPPYWSTTPFIERRDVIVYDQRGTGISEPDANCPEVEEAVLVAFADALPYEEEAAAGREAVTACHDRLVDEGVDLTAFSTPASAADLADLRVALGYEEWNLLGISYGTRLAQETLRSHPEGIRSVILDSTYPLDEGSVAEVVEGAQRAFDQLAAGCAADPGCDAANPDLPATFQDVIERYDAEPHRSTVDLGPDDGGEIDIVITGADIVAGLFTAMYDTELIPVLPTFATTLATGDSALVDQVAAQGIPFINGLAEGMALSTNCADSAPVRDEKAAADAELLADPGQWSTIATVFSTSFCDLWTHGEIAGSFVDPVRSDMHVLVLSGTYDPVTSTPGAQTVADSLGNATFVTFDGLGHGTWDVTECGTAITLAYLDDPTAELDTTCAAAVGPPAFS
jgi:pimeloyl-ACP methyl ester carboxylesterase